MVERRFLLIPVALVATLLVSVSCTSVPTEVDTQQPFFEGKTIRIISGFSPGGPIDLRARLFARHLSHYIPGAPTIIVQNMAGAGGIVAANSTFGGVAEPDGLTMLHFPSSTVMNALLLKERVSYDIREIPILWAQADGYVTVANPITSKVKTIEDLASPSVELAAGGTGVTSLRSLRTRIALLLLGVEHTWVDGYVSTAALVAALDREEVHLAELALASYTTLIEPREQEGTARMLWQTGFLRTDGSFERSAIAPNVPTLDEFLPEGTKEGPAWEAWKAAVVPLAFQAVVGLPPGVSPERIQILSEAFRAMGEDPEYQRDLHRILGEEPADALVGDEATRLVDTGLQQLLEEFQEGMQYLRELSVE